MLSKYFEKILKEIFNTVCFVSFDFGKILLFSKKIQKRKNKSLINIYAMQSLKLLVNDSSLKDRC